MPTRRTAPVIVPGKTVTRFHLEYEGGGAYSSKAPFELHVANYPNGDLEERAQWYEILERPNEDRLNVLKRELRIDDIDWRILFHTLGSFKWGIFFHPKKDEKSQIKVDVDAMKKQEWSTTYF